MTKKRRIRRRFWTNAKGQKNSAALEAPDLNQCQAQPNVMAWGPFSLGPMPKPIRCTNTSHFVIVENKATHKDGLIGAMSLCGDCLALFRKHRSPTFAKVHAITEVPSGGVSQGEGGRAPDPV